MSLLHRVLVGTLAISSLATLTPSLAATATAQFDVTITITPKCTFDTSTINNMDFGSQDIAETNLGSTTNFRVVCTKTTPYTLTMMPADSTTDGTGTLKGQTAPNLDTIHYALFQDVSHTQPWGTTTGTNTAAGTGSGDPVNHPVYALISTIGNIAPDTYRDTVTVSIAY